MLLRQCPTGRKITKKPYGRPISKLQEKLLYLLEQHPNANALTLTLAAKYKLKEKTELALQGLISREMISWEIPKVCSPMTYSLTHKGRTYLRDLESIKA